MVVRETQIQPGERFNRIGMVARWRPVHRGHAAILDAMVSRADTVLIGIGSANKYNLRNPFTVEETMDMIRLVLGDTDGASLIPVQDLDDGPRWRRMLIDLFGPLDLFVTDNPYVGSLLAEDYPLIRPVRLVPESQRIPLDGTRVRREMARGDGWKSLVPDPVVEYLVARGLVDRFRREFGLETLAQETLEVR